LKERGKGAKEQRHNEKKRKIMEKEGYTDIRALSCRSLESPAPYPLLPRNTYVEAQSVRPIWNTLLTYGSENKE
jgi:hypothetical protein